MKALMKVLAALAFAVLLWTAGLVVFGVKVARTTPARAPAHADGLVALTGASSRRIAAAAELLEHGKAHRLLISGVDPRATRRAVRGVARDVGREWDCCVDLGFRAQSTRGNASETARWVRRHGYRSLIVVTADYHMPRALLELHAAMPDVALSPYPVATETLDARRWWGDATSTRRLAVEYSKYLVIRARDAVRARVRPTAASMANAV